MNVSNFLSKFLIVIVAVITLAACQPATPVAPTATPTVASTATITPTPTITPLPPDLLTASSCSRVEMKARIGKGKISQMLYSPDGALLLIASAGSIDLYDAKQAKLLWNGITQTGVSAITMDTALQRVLVIDKNETFHLLEMGSGKLFHSVEQDKENDTYLFAMSPDGKTSATASFNGVIYQYDTEEFNQKIAIDGPGASPDAMFADSFYLSMEYSPKGKYIALATLRAEIYIYDANTGKLIQKIEPLSPDYDNRIFPNHMAFSQDEQMLAIAYDDGQTLVRKTIASQPGELLEGSLPSLSPDGSTVALKTSKGIELFQTSIGNSLGSLPETETALGNSIFSPDGQSLAVIMPEKMVFWDIKELMVEETVKTTFTDYQAMAISQNGETFAASFQQLVEIFQTKSGDRRALAWEHPVQFLKFSANDSALVVAGSTSLSILDPKQDKVIKKIELPGNIQGMDISNDGQTAAIVIEGNLVMLYNLSSGEGKTISTPSQKIVSATFLDNTNVLALDDDEEVYVSTLQEPTLANITAFDVSALIASNRYSTIAFITNLGEVGETSIYDIAKQKFLESPLEFKSIFAISPVNNIVAIPDANDKTLTLLDIHDPDSSCEITDFDIDATQMMFSPDGKLLMIQGRNGIIYMFGVKPQEIG